jgi:hypothetical protein
MACGAAVAAKTTGAKSGFPELRVPLRSGIQKAFALLLLLLVACSGPQSDRSLHGAAATQDPSVAVTRWMNDLTAPALAEVIRTSRDAALEEPTRPILPGVRKAMLPFFEEQLLDDVRWTVSSARPGVDTLLAGALEYEGAVTLGNVIVFFDEASARNPKLWIHELHHVRQYRELGIDQFATLYVGRWREIEAKVEADTNHVLAQLERKRTASARRSARNT